MIPGPGPTLIVTATRDKICTDGVLKAVELIKKKQENKSVILVNKSHIDQLTNTVKYSGFQFHIGPSGFNEEDSGCWIMDYGDFDGMESRSVIMLDHGYICMNYMMRCTTNLIVVMERLYFTLYLYSVDNCKVKEI